MPEIIVSDLGTTVPLNNVRLELLADLGQRILGDQASRFIGAASTNLAEQRRLKELASLDILDGVRHAAETTSEPSEQLQLIGVDLVRGQPPFTEYERPRGDGWKGNDADEFFRQIVHAHVALEDEVRITPSLFEQSVTVIQPGQLLLARPEARYKVGLPVGAINLELVLCRTQADSASLWNTYL